MDDSLLSKAFDVEAVSEDFNPSVPPSTGLEYLQHVMYEASKCPKVVVAKIDRSKIKNNININIDVCNQIKGGNFAPSPDWERQQIAIFSDVRKKVEKSKESKKFKPIPLPKLQDEDSWFNICFGDKSLEPSLTLLLSMNEPLLSGILEYQLEWLENSLKPNQGKWIYALLVCLDLPLVPTTCSILRDLARKCAKIRCSQTLLEESDVTVFNLIICLVSKYFGQMDLLDL